ncbi:MAG: phenylacetaldehyde dehydrogenase, partial [Gaiellaceae bacterium]|nr:phenylacetaldehyde dehydrogenase [Gaiellaceae bacterium]
VADEVVERIVAIARGLKVGDPNDPTVQLGPLASERQHDRVRSYLELAVTEHAHAAVGGSTLDRPGFYVEPTVFVGVEAQMRIAREEIFGPVLSVIPFDTEEEATAIANSVEFGLSANIWTSDVSRMLRLAERIEAGTIWGNTARLLHPGLPFGGFKDSGLGNASGEGALEGNTRLKRVSVLYDAQGPGFAA